MNIYLDIARELGEPFTWEKFEATLAADPGDSLLAIAALRSGVMPDGCSVEVWTSDHIDYLVALKASQPTRAQDERNRGLGWSSENAQALVDELVGDLIFCTNGGSIGDVPISYGTPPLDHEDGCVYATVRDGGHEAVYYDRYCLTRDGHFLRANLPGLIDVLHPRDWVLRHRALARATAFKRMLGH
ncbi:hypothetical protein [Microbacterium sp. cf046]|uniref:hypothetical protein n=1 Tax=Microbacterium sp. cf046 TaxID=1761803 RepID=UPI000B838CBB|nr:hypothetical protein [Microbacterium sp. cf046]